MRTSFLEKLGTSFRERSEGCSAPTYVMLGAFKFDGHPFKYLVAI